jgi:hypothetical protein
MDTTDLCDAGRTRREQETCVGVFEVPTPRSAEKRNKKTRGELETETDIVAHRTLLIGLLKF